MLLIVTGPIASGKSTLARAIACGFQARDVRGAVVDLDLVYEMLLPARGPKGDATTWAEARRVAARLAAMLLDERDVVVVEGGDFLTEDERADFTGALPPGVVPRFVTLSVAFDIALERATRDTTRGVSRDPDFLRWHYDQTERAVRHVPVSDLRIDTGRLKIEDAAAVVIEWAAARERPR